jgi:hypothetical protein
MYLRLHRSAEHAGRLEEPSVPFVKGEAATVPVTRAEGDLAAQRAQLVEPSPELVGTAVG